MSRYWCQASPGGGVGTAVATWCASWSAVSCARWRQRRREIPEWPQAWSLWFTVTGGPLDESIKVSTFSWTCFSKWGLVLSGSKSDKSTKWRPSLESCNHTLEKPRIVKDGPRVGKCEEETQKGPKHSDHARGSCHLSRTQTPGGPKRWASNSDLEQALIYEKKLNFPIYSNRKIWTIWGNV